MLFQSFGILCDFFDIEFWGDSVAYPGVYVLSPPRKYVKTFTVCGEDRSMEDADESEVEKNTTAERRR